MKKDKIIIAKYKKIISLQTDLSIVENSLRNIYPWTTKYITASNQKEAIYEEIRQLKKDVDNLSIIPDYDNEISMGKPFD